MSLTHIFFDLDGTLVDSSEGIHNGFVQTFERLGLPVPSDQKIRTFMGPPLEADVLQRAITENQAPKDQSVIVGDTKFDLIGGKTVGIKTIAVTWGFGENETLLAENPDFIADTTQELWDILK